MTTKKSVIASEEPSSYVIWIGSVRYISFPFVPLETDLRSYPSANPRISNTHLKSWQKASIAPTILLSQASTVVWGMKAK